jgi:regulator of replication initiation timing
MPEPEIDQLKKRIKALEDDASEMRRDKIHLQMENRNLEDELERNEQAEQEWYAERDKLRATLRKRGQTQLEKATLKTRVAAVKSLAALLPQAKKQARQGKPALLRLILRASR